MDEGVGGGGLVGALGVPEEAMSLVGDLQCSLRLLEGPIGLPSVAVAVGMTVAPLVPVTRIIRTLTPTG